MSVAKRSFPAGVLIVVGLAAPAPAQDPVVEPAVLMMQIAEKCASAKQYVFEGYLDVSRKSGERPMEVLTKAKVKLTVMPGDKYVLRVENPDKTSYVAVSDGQTRWVYVPGLKKYTEQEAVAVRTKYYSRENLEDPQPDAPAEIIHEFSLRVMPILAGLGENPTDVFQSGAARVKYEGQELVWPVLTVLSKKGDQVSQKLTYLTIDPATLVIAKMIWTTPVSSAGEKVLVRLGVDFDSFHIGESTADSEFSFTPPPDAKRVDALPTAGQSGVLLVNKPAPEFELKNFDDHSIRLGDLKGYPVLLYFWTTWCGPCKSQLPLLAKVSEEYKDKGLVVLGIGDEGKDTAVGYLSEAKLPFDFLDDAARKVQRLYRVNSVPTVVLINRKGNVVRYFSGVPDEHTLRAALKSAGL